MALIQRLGLLLPGLRAAVVRSLDPMYHVRFSRGRFRMRTLPPIVSKLLLEWFTNDPAIASKAGSR